MDIKNRLESILSQKKSELLQFINYKTSKDLRKQFSAEDLLNELMVYCLAHPQDIDRRGDADLLIFLKWKAKMLIYDRARRNVKVDPEYAAEKIAEGRGREEVGDSPTLLLHRRDKQVALRKYLASIKSPEQRMAMELVRLEGLSVDEVAQRMGKRRTAIEKLLERGFASLISSLRSSGGMKYATTGETT